jgi:hypothetical protein
MRGLVLLMLVLPLAACGGTEGAGSTGASTSLEITVQPNGASGETRTATVTCPGDDVCDQLEALDAKAFAPVPSGMMCTQIYGGPETAHVAGTFKGTAIDASFKRSDGCEIARWSRVQFLFARAG